jgi:glucan biosynthesis protein C
MCRTHQQCVWGTWLAVLVAALALQVGLRAVNGIMSHYTTTYILVLTMTVVYGRVLVRHWWNPENTNTNSIHPSQEAPPAASLAEEAVADEVPESPVLPQKQEQMDLEATEVIEMPEEQTNENIDDNDDKREHYSGGISASNHNQQFASSHERPAPAQRLFFLDNVKIFLTFLVLSHHVLCAFGGCSGGWFLIVGEYDCSFRQVAESLTLLNQAYFMPLFFLISAYFVPSSYDNKGKTAFLLGKAKRIWVPAMGVFFTVTPFTLMIAQAVAKAAIEYIPLPGHCWFLFYLLLFNWIYITIREASARDNHTGAETEIENVETSAETAQAPDPSPPWPFPSIWKRLCYGLLICGLAMLVIFMIVEPVFYSMPITVGSLACSAFLFGVGVAAKQNGWFSRSIKEQLGMPVWGLRLVVVLEATALVALLPFLVPNENDDSEEEDELDASAIPLGFLFFLVAGVYCIDMSLAVLEFFQAHAAGQTKMSRYLAEAAYTVYLIHPLVVVAATSAFVVVYNILYDDAIKFEKDSILSESELGGPGDGSLHLFVGWVIVFVISHSITWPLSWWIRRLPGFKQVL